MAGAGRVIVAPIAPTEVDMVVAVLCDAFHDYPAMRFVLGADDPDYARRLPALIGLFVRARVARGAPVLGARDEANRLVGVATPTPPAEGAPPPAFVASCETVWKELGAAERIRYDAFVAASDRAAAPAPHYSLNSSACAEIGRGRGSGVGCSDPANVPLYEHAGYRTLGRNPVAPGLDTWALWRPDEAKPA